MHLENHISTDDPAVIFGGACSGSDLDIHQDDALGNPVVSFTLGQTSNGLPASKHHLWNADRTKVITESPVFPVSGTLQHVECALLDIMDLVTSPDQFIVLGVPKGTQPNEIRKLITDQAAKSGAEGLARTTDNFCYRDHALLMVDVDIKDEYCVPCMSAITPQEAIGLLEKALSISLDGVAKLIKPSASANLFDEDGNPLKQSSGFHIYMVLGGCEPAYFHEVVHKRLVIAGHGHAIIASNGRILIRTPFDATVGQTNRVDFFAEPVLDSGIIRKTEVQRVHGTVLDLSHVDLSVNEDAYEAVVAKIKKTAKVTEIQKVRVEKWTIEKANELEAIGVSAQEAIARAANLASRIKVDTNNLDIYPKDGVIFQFDSGEQLSLEELLARADEFEDKTLSDPFDDEGAHGKAKFYANKGKKPAIHSFAHGGATYYLHESEPDVFDPTALANAMNQRYALVTVGNKVRIMCHKLDKDGKPDFDLLCKTDFETRLCNQVSPEKISL